jgi:hypothetical protein
MQSVSPCVTLLAVLVSVEVFTRVTCSLNLALHYANCSSAGIGLMLSVPTGRATACVAFSVLVRMSAVLEQMRLR